MIWKKEGCVVCCGSREKNRGKDNVLLPAVIREQNECKHTLLQKRKKKHPCRLQKATTKKK